MAITQEEQDRLNAAAAAVAKIFTYDEYLANEIRELQDAAKPLLEKEPRVGYVTEDASDTEMRSYKAIEIMDTPYIVQKGRKPIKLDARYTLLRQAPAAREIYCALAAVNIDDNISNIEKLIESLRVDCDDTN